MAHKKKHKPQKNTVNIDVAGASQIQNYGIYEGIYQVFALGSKNRGIYSIFWTVPSKNTGTYPVFIMLQEIFFPCMSHKTPVN